MIDFEDVEIVAISGGGGGGPFVTLLFVLLVGILLIVATCNSNECVRRHCPNGGTPRLMNHSCLCVQEAR